MISYQLPCITHNYSVYFSEKKYDDFFHAWIIDLCIKSLITKVNKGAFACENNSLEEFFFRRYGFTI